MYSITSSYSPKDFFWGTTGLDYLSAPTGPIKEAQELAARAFGADTTWFLVNGTTVGIQAAVMATCSPGDTLILARNCHLAAFSGMVLTGCQPCYVQPGMQRGSVAQSPLGSAVSGFK